MSGGKNKLFMADPIAFMKKYACFPADLLEGQQGRPEKQIPMQINGNDKLYPINKMEDAYKITYLDFAKRPRGSSFNAGFAAVADESISVGGSYTPTPGRVKAYFLPWYDSGIIKLDIPALGFSAAHDDVKYFFTAGITGCSIFVRGTPQQPIVYHAGGQTGTGNDNVAGAKFWRDMVQTHEGGAFFEVNKTDYCSGVGLGQLRTTESDAYEAWLKANGPQDLNVQMTSPFGCVMGIRGDNGHWAFYLQQNATVIYTKIKKQTFSNKTVTTTRGVARPMIFNRFFPQGPANVVFNPAIVRSI
ncbi:hypothetical protein [Granulicella arctica]|uniref:hypothetical protein n=1 Tax=Granulicella arctica TaxID=940613 RepID=UPI0021E02954|nr:hypothetical protein [Granulicella arctica]